MNICAVRAEFHADGRTECLDEAIVSFCSFVNPLKNIAKSTERFAKQPTERDLYAVQQDT
jgi:hypothetical protein